MCKKFKEMDNSFAYSGRFLSQMGTKIIISYNLEFRLWVG